MVGVSHPDGMYVLFSDHEKALAELQVAHEIRGEIIEIQNEVLNLCHADCDNFKSLLAEVSEERDRLKEELDYLRKVGQASL
jgi:indole-3-glycerol phosphate synthase